MVAVGTSHAVPQTGVDKQPAAPAFGDRRLIAAKPAAKSCLPLSLPPFVLTRNGILTRTSSIPASASSTPSLSAPVNAQEGNNPNTGAAFSNAQASLFTILGAIGVVAMAL